MAVGCIPGTPCHCGLGLVNDILGGWTVFTRTYLSPTRPKTDIGGLPNISIMTKKDKMSKFFIFFLEFLSINKNIYNHDVFLYNQ